MIAWLTLLPVVLGFCCLCASMSRHQGDLFQRRLRRGPSRGLRRLGLVLLTVALAADWVLLTPIQGTMFWFGHLTVGALIAASALVFAKRARGRRDADSNP